MTKLAPPQKKVRPDISDGSAATIGIGRQTWLKMESGKKAVDLVYDLTCVGYDAGQGE
ncbi:hypothetical protein [Terasakiella sp.]|uniref:hypothetical protein n=1 Tax=Terasakiella sp. TaxID=2034861 RepID=UPI003AA7AFFA